MAELRACPGERVLIVGNDDTDQVALAEAGFTTRHRVALYEEQPPGGDRPGRPADEERRGPPNRRG